MNNLQQDFLEQSIKSLENLIERLRDETGAGAFSAQFSRQSFRTLHTIKGTAQTFGFPVSGSLAHGLENLLSVAKDGQAFGKEDCKIFFLNGLELLKQTFERADTNIPTEFVEKLRRLAPSPNAFEARLTTVPDEIFLQLSEREKNVATSTEHAGQNLFCLEIGFDLAKFAEGLTGLREVLGENGEIIATLPSRKPYAPGKIGFQILLATAKSAAVIKRIAEKNSAEIVFEKSKSNFSNDLTGVFEQIAEHVRELAEQLGKKIDLEVSTGEHDVPPQILKTVFDALLHLARNAVDHGIEKPEERAAAGKSPRGRIKIQFSSDENSFNLTVGDDGRGIDAEKIRVKAAEKNLVPGGDLPEQSALELIFAPGLSTAERLTDVSGRGVGLDAVRDLIERDNGKIGVVSRKNEGATFEISLPRPV